MSKIPTLRNQIMAMNAAPTDATVKQLSEVIDGLCAGIEKIERIANDALSEAKRAKRTSRI